MISLNRQKLNRVICFKNSIIYVSQYKIISANSVSFQRNFKQMIVKCFYPIFGSSNSLENHESVYKTQDEGNLGKWSEPENMKYVAFLYKHKVKFSCRLKKRKIRLFEEMASFMGTRSTIQCRTHHQKFQNKLGSTKAILQAFKAQFGPDNFKKIVKELNSKKNPDNIKNLYSLPTMPNLAENKASQNQIAIQTDLPNQEIAETMPLMFQLSGNMGYCMPVFFY